MTQKKTPYPAEFEEKEYEIPLYLELASGGKIWTPGQVLEEHLGWEAAIQASSAYWTHVGRLSKTGVYLQGAVLGLPRGHAPLSSSGASPRFRANLFIQAKRCTRYALGPRSLQGVDPRREQGQEVRGFSVYTRPVSGHRPTRHQQQALERLHHRLQRGGVRGEVCYAAPVFDERADLWSAAVRREIVAKSTFPRAILLKNHSKWVYTEPGTRGWKCSEPEYEDGESFGHFVSRWSELEREEGLKVREPDGRGLANPLMSLAVSVKEALIDGMGEEGEALDAEDVVEPVQDGRREALRRAFDGLGHEPTLLVAWILAAASAWGLLWLVVGPQRDA